MNLNDEQIWKELDSRTHEFLYESAWRYFHLETLFKIHSQIARPSIDTSFFIEMELLIDEQIAESGGINP